MFPRALEYVIRIGDSLKETRNRTVASRDRNSASVARACPVPCAGKRGPKGNFAPVPWVDVFGVDPWPMYLLPTDVKYRDFHRVMGYKVGPHQRRHGNSGGEVLSRSVCESVS